ncbi:MAG: hypothetical protein IH987_01675 [Planctomycetes bacterium]|nr:hypothetical protein [Planctomycetota bacterium]
MRLLINYACCDPVTSECTVTAPADCLGTYLGDGTDCTPNCCPIDPFSEGDCNGNGIPDECDILDGTSNDCNGNGIPDECDLIVPPVDLVFIMDTSGSMDDEARALCCDLESAILNLGLAGFDITTTLLGITENPGGDFACLESNVRDEFGDVVPGTPPPCCTTLGNLEDWGPATAIVAANFPWVEEAIRIIVPVSDEGPRNGNTCFDPGSDRDSITHAISICQENSVIASPITGTGSNSCVITLATDLADGTGGTMFESNDPEADLAGAIIEIVLAAASHDCNANAIPDECEVPPIDPVGPDCNSNGTPDDCEEDCQPNGTPDDCDIAGGAADVDGNGVPDECQDCNGNGVFDPDDISGGTSQDCNTNAIPDECEIDCNGNGVPDDCDIDSGFSDDCTSGCGNGIPDECEADCNFNGVADTCDLVLGNSEDCNVNTIPDECDIRVEDGGFCVGAECSLDCQPNGIPDECEFADGSAVDCNGNGIPDICDILNGLGADCNGDGALDECNPGVKPGHDLFVTDAAIHDFAETPLPADFFGTGSDPFAESVNFVGDPIGNYNGFDVEDTDTIIERLEDANFVEVVSSDTIDIELVALSLKSNQPIEVTFNGGTSSKFYDIVISLSPSVPSLGTMTINRTTCAGGNYEASIDVVPFFTFTEVDDPPAQFTLDAADIGYHADVDTSNFPSWERVPTHDQTIALGLTGDASNVFGAPWWFDFYIFGDVAHEGPHPEVHSTGTGGGGGGGQCAGITSCDRDLIGTGGLNQNAQP